MELTPKEQKRIKRLERIARSSRIWDYLLAAMAFVVLGISVYCTLANQRMWTRIFLFLSALLFMVLMYLRDTRFLVHIIKKLRQ